ncbi:MAG: hypothetical protein ABMB14_25015 [Myxococcota bacterium]
MFGAGMGVYGAIHLAILVAFWTRNDPWGPPWGELFALGGVLACAGGFTGAVVGGGAGVVLGRPACRAPSWSVALLAPLFPGVGAAVGGVLAAIPSAAILLQARLVAGSSWDGVFIVILFVLGCGSGALVGLLFLPPAAVTLVGRQWRPEVRRTAWGMACLAAFAGQTLALVGLMLVASLS